MSKRLGEDIPIKCVITDAIGNPITTFTDVELQVMRDSDQKWWDGAAWQAAPQDLAMAHLDEGVYSHTLNTGHAAFLNPSQISYRVYSSTDEFFDIVYGSMNFDLDEDYLTKKSIVVNEFTSSGNGNVGGTTVVSTALTEVNDYWNDMQLLCLSGANEGQVRRILDFDAGTDTITVDTAFTNQTLTSDTWIIVGRVTGAASALTVGAIADGVWDEQKAGHVAANSYGKIVQDVETDVNTLLTETQTNIPADIAASEVAIIAEIDANETKIDTLTTNLGTHDTDIKAVLGSPPSDLYTDLKAEIDANETKIDTAITDIGTVDTNLGTHDTDIKAVLGSPPSDLYTDLKAEIDANETKIDTAITDIGSHDTDIKALVGSPSVDLATDIAANLSAIQAVQNNTRFTAAVPNPMQKPDSSDKAYRHAANLYDTQGDMEDPNDSEILVRIIKNDGTYITSALFKENALTNALDSATDQVNFPTASGWRAMEREDVGKYFYFYKVTSTETEEALTVEFGWEEGVQLNYQSRATKISDTQGDIEDIQSNVQDIHDKLPTNYIMGSGVLTDKDDEIDDILTDTGTTIPAQITQHDTDIKALPNIKATPRVLYVPSGETAINLEGGITAVVATIPVLDVSQLETEGTVLIESEYITYTGISASNELTGCTRGAFGSSGAIHADAVAVYKTLVYPLRLSIYDNAGNMVAPDSIPTIGITDWLGNVELAPTAMTLLSTGVYGYNYIVSSTARPEPKVVNYVVVENSITRNVPSTLLLVDEPASENSLINLVGGGQGEFLVDENGWWDSSGILQLWTDAMKEYLRDATTGDRLDNVWITAYKIIGGVPVIAVIPPGQARCNNNGEYGMRLDKGTYRFFFFKDQYQFPIDNVDREVDP